MQPERSYSIPPAEAQGALIEVSAGLTALIDFEAWMRHFQDWLDHLGATLGVATAP